MQTSSQKKRSVSIACASAFWGDTPYAVQQLLLADKLDYLVFDYLSEAT
ncbi:MAG: acyclic terpene utilization AtuA family protein, partial [Bdellovibrionota bacterium]